MNKTANEHDFIVPYPIRACDSVSSLVFQINSEAEKDTPFIIPWMSQSKTPCQNRS